MHINDFERVTKLMDEHKRILRAIDQCDKFEDPERDDNWWGKISVHHDGSGSHVDLKGCNVLYEVVEATKEVLERKKESVEENLISLGVKL